MRQFGRLDVLVNNAAEQHPKDSPEEIDEKQLERTFRTNIFGPHKVEKFGSDVPLGRAGEPWECANCFVFLASQESSYMTGQVLHPNGGEIING